MAVSSLTKAPNFESPQIVSQPPTAKVVLYRKDLYKHALSALGFLLAWSIFTYVSQVAPLLAESPKLKWVEAWGQNLNAFYLFIGLTFICLTLFITHVAVFLTAKKNTHIICGAIVTVVTLALVFLLSGVETEFRALGFFLIACAGLQYVLVRNFVPAMQPSH